MRRHPTLAVVAAALALSLAACGGDGEEDGETLTVLAAASLTDTYTRLADDFEADHQGVEVRLSFGGSADLVTQVQEGAPADVVATADTEAMQVLVDDGLVAEPEVFATNTPRLVVPRGNPAGITGLADLERDDVRLVVCAPQVPCGKAALALADAAGVELAPVSEEQAVTDVLAKVASGEADAGLVYVTDVRAAGDDVEGVAVPGAGSVVNRYPVATVAGSEHDDLARAFVDLVTGPRGRTVLSDAGFGTP